MTVGVFVGGRARRMGGFPKGLLPAPGGSTVVERCIALARGLGAAVVLVGRNDAYDLGVPSLPDAAPDTGPMGGLLSLLEHVGDGVAVALACDMPHVSAALLARLVLHAPSAAAVAPRRDRRWEPLFARYDALRVAPAVRARLSRRELSLQGLLDEVGTEELPMAADDSRLLDDWDSPEDIA